MGFKWHKALKEGPKNVCKLRSEKSILSTHYQNVELSRLSVRMIAVETSLDRNVVQSILTDHLQKKQNSWIFAGKYQENQIYWIK